MVLGALVGILTHLAWDAFTHESSDLVQAVPVLHAQAGPLLVSAWLQHVSTVVGLVILTAWTARWVRRTAPDARRPSWATARGRVASWVSVVVVPAIVGAVAWGRMISSGLPPFDPGPVFVVATTAGAAVGVTVLIVCACWWVARATGGRATRS
jgi:hypothetical protein